MSHGCLVKNPAVVCTDMDDGAVLLDLDSTAYYSINRTARRIWQLLDEEPTLEGIATRLATEYAVGYDDALASASRLVATLEHEQLVKAERS